MRLAEELDEGGDAGVFAKEEDVGGGIEVDGGRAVVGMGIEVGELIVFQCLDSGFMVDLENCRWAARELTDADALVHFEDRFIVVIAGVEMGTRWVRVALVP